MGTSTTTIRANFSQSNINTMLSTARSRAIWQLSRRASASARRTYAFSANDKQEINDPVPSKSVPNISKTNELPMETPHRDLPLVEKTEDAEKLRVSQAPNRKSVWSKSQNPRAKAMSGPRFEQTIMEYQVSQSIIRERWTAGIGLKSLKHHLTTQC